MFLNHAFGHCWLIMGLDDNQSMGIEVLQSRVTARLLNRPVAQAISDIAPHCSAILHHVSHHTKDNFLTMRGMINCTTLCKALLDVRGWALTPFQLYKYLRKHHNATIIKPWVPHA